MSRARRSRMPWHLWRTLLCAGVLTTSLGMHALVVLSFIFRWDKAALVTVVPFPFWCAMGALLALIAVIFRRTALTRILIVVWFMTLILGADERHGLLGWKRESPQTGTPTPFASQQVIRLVTLNCFNDNPEAAREVAAWHPDIVFLQESPYPNKLRKLALDLFGEHALLAHSNHCAILARGQGLQRIDFQTPGFRPRALCARLILPDGRPLDLLNLHLPSAARNTEFWTRACWSEHARNRRARHFTLAYLLNIQARTLANWPPAPGIVGGDFNAPAGDRAIRQLATHYLDSYPQAGHGLGNTFPNHFPIHRIDQVWLSPGLQAVRQGTATTQHSDHRMVVVDFLMAPGTANTP